MTDPSDTLNQALALHRLGHLREAETLYRQVLLRDPLQAEALNLLGGLLSDSARPVEASMLLRQAVAQAPDSPEFYVGLGDCERKAGDLEVAETCYRTALQFNAAHEGSVCSLGEMLEEQGRLDEAERVYRGMLQHEPDAIGVPHGLAGVLRKLGRLDEAEVALERVCALAPGLVRALGDLAGLRLRQGRPGPAATAFREALARDPKAVAAHEGLVRSLLADGRLDDAVAAGDVATDLPEVPASLYCALGAALALAGRNEAALRGVVSRVFRTLGLASDPVRRPPVLSAGSC